MITTIVIIIITVIITTIVTNVVNEDMSFISHTHTHKTTTTYFHFAGSVTFAFPVVNHLLNLLIPSSVLYLCKIFRLNYVTMYLFCKV